jgi:3D (Asp-Asp-Asp) domain-containing protein
MKEIVMRIALLAGIVCSNATAVSVPTALPPALPTRAMATARAAAASQACSLPHASLPVALPRLEPARRHGYAITADHPRPPLGRFKLTAYSGPQLGQARPITATGTSARAGRTVAVDPKVIPLGSRIYIDGIGERIAEDIGGGVKGQHIDLYLPSRPQARRFGVQRGTVSVVVLPAQPSS